MINGENIKHKRTSGGLRKGAERIKDKNFKKFKALLMAARLPIVERLKIALKPFETQIGKVNYVSPVIDNPDLYLANIVGVNELLRIKVYSKSTAHIWGRTEKYGNFILRINF